MGVKGIDGHRHVVFPEVSEVGSKLDPVKSSNIYPPGVDPNSEKINRKKGAIWDHKMSDFDANLADLQAAGMDVGILQPTQTMFFYWAKGSAAAELSRMVNEGTAKGVREYPDHFVGLATIPLQDMDAAVRELIYAVQELGLKGVVTGSNVNGHGFDEERFHPFFEKVQELDVPIFIHPNNPAGAERVGRYYMANFLALPLESAIMASQVVFSGVLDRYPDLKFCLSHAGGVLPFLLGRLEHGQSQRPEAQENCEHPFSHYLKNFYVDTITFRPETLRFVLDMIPEGHVFMGTDYPYDMADTDPVGSVKAAVSDERLQEDIMGRNLGSLMGLI
ncbi:MAG: amidohydrolase family protein [Deltaproteobacteria bacterium]|nr:amidohydrolase family protein [Deltaproteobacteria bacterium]